MNVGENKTKTPKVDQMPTASVMRDVGKLDSIYPPRETIMRNEMIRMKAHGLTIVYKGITLEEPKKRR